MIIIRMLLLWMIVCSHLLTMICAFSLSRMSPSQQQQTRQGRCRPSFFGLELCNASNGDHTENKSEDASLDRTTQFRNHLLREEEDDDDDEALQQQQQQQEQQQQLRNTFFALRHGQSDANVQGLIASNPRIACYRYGLSATGQEQAKQAGHDLIQLYRNTTTTHRNTTTTTANTDNTNSPVGIAIVSSDLLRAKETAQIVATTILEYNNNNECLDNSNDNTNINSDLEWKIPLYYDDESTSNNDDNNNNYSNSNSNSNSNNGSHINRYVSMDVRLRERNFGNWDGQSDRHYKDVWKEDQIDPYQTKQNVESVWMVTDRVTDCIVEWDRKLTPTLTSTTTTAATVAENKNRCWWIICVAHGDVLQILQTAFHNNMDPSEHRSVQHLETATLRRLRFQTNKME